MLKSRLQWPGVPFALLSAALFGASVPFSKQLLSSVDPWLLAGLLYVGSGIGLSLFLILRTTTGQRKAEASLDRESIPWLIGAVMARRSDGRLGQCGYRCSLPMLGDRQ